MRNAGGFFAGRDLCLDEIRPWLVLIVTKLVPVERNRCM